MTLTPRDLRQLFELAEELEEHPERWQTAKAIAAAIRRQANFLRALINADD